MIRRWFRALARPEFLGRPSPVSPKVGRPLRTLLRLEAVEDRTLASAAPVEQPDPQPAQTETHAGATSDSTKPTASDDQSQSTTDGAVLTPTDGWNTGWQSPDGPILMAGDGHVTPVESSTPVVIRTQATLDARFSGELNLSEEPPARPTRSKSTQAADTGASVATDLGGAKPAGSDSSSDSTGQPAAPPARGSVEAASDIAYVVNNATASQARRMTDAKVTTSRQVTVDSDAAGSRINRTTRAPRTEQAPAARAGQTVPADLTDGALLQRYVANREQEAFTALVRRHGPLVLGVCQRVLGDYHAAQDASQATFVVLARKAGMLDRTSPLGGWLYKVAYHLALRSRAVAARQRLGERDAAADESAASTTDTTPEVEQREIVQVLREELQGLPEKYRAPLALVYIDGRSHADAAQAIGLPRGSMAKRVGEGLDRLRERLTVRGLGL